MLILTRRVNERIFIGDDVVLVVLGIESNRVKLGLDAPNEIPILREEIVNDALKERHDARDIEKATSNRSSLKTGTG